MISLLHCGKKKIMRYQSLLPLLLIFLLTFRSSISFGDPSDSLNASDLGMLTEVLKRDKEIKYQTGSVDLNAEISLNIPSGYKFMPKADAEFVVYDFWGNPRRDGVLGMIVKQDYSLLDSNATWAFVVSYENSGYVKDEDADKIDYEEMMTEMQESEAEENKERKTSGYPSIHIVGWATHPFYDKQNNILHWAKSIKFGDSEDTTLNYDVRILGRKGILSLNAVGTLTQLDDIKKHVPEIIHIASFKKGSSYSDFDPSMDKVAAYTIGGLVAGKLLAKAGLIALLLKNIKLIILGFLALGAGFKNKILGLFKRKDKADDMPSNGSDNATQDSEPSA
jgi:uncharacterized membrane-anchored protein